MRSWAALRESLVREVRTWKSVVAFKSMQESAPALARFGDASALLADLTTVGGDLDAKDAVYHDLVGIAQSGPPTARRTASTLLFLGLWNGLDGIYRRRFRLFGAAEDAASEVTACFLEVVRRADMSRIRRLAATLVWNTERVLIERWKRQHARQSREAQLTDKVMERPVPATDAGLLHELATDDPMREAEAVERWVASIVGRDAKLVVGVAVHEQTEHEAAVAAGVSHEAGRKRYQRALRRLRDHVGAVSQMRPKRRV